MAWKDTLLDASFRGVVFDCQRTDDAIERDVARYSYPYVDGEDIVDLGQKANELSLTAVFWGDDYETKLKNFLGALAIKGAGELIHPVFGSMPKMQFLGGHVSHDAENVDHCLVELRFAASTPSNPFFVQQLTTQVADVTAQTAQVAQSAGTSLFSKALSALNVAKAGLRRLNALRDMLSDTLGPIKALVAGVQTTALDYLEFPSAFTADLISLVSGMTDLRSFDIGSIMSDWGGMIAQMQTVVKLPTAASYGQTVTMPGVTVSPTLPDGPVDPTAPYTPARTNAISADPADIASTNSVVLVVVATTTASVVSDLLANEVDQPTLTPDEIEQITNDTRTLIEQAIEAVTASGDLDETRPVAEALRNVALSVQQLAIGTIDALPPLITRTVPSSCNLTLLAFRWYGDYTRSAELLRLNPSIHNPNFIEAGEVLRAFAQ